MWSSLRHPLYIVQSPQRERGADSHITLDAGHCSKHTMINPPLWYERPHQTLWWVPGTQRRVTCVFCAQGDLGCHQLANSRICSDGFLDVLGPSVKRKGRFLSKGRKSSGQFFWRIEPLLQEFFILTQNTFCFWSSEWWLILKWTQNYTRLSFCCLQSMWLWSDFQAVPMPSPSRTRQGWYTWNPGLICQSCQSSQICSLHIYFISIFLVQESRQF